VLKNKIWNCSSAPSTDFWDETAIAEIDGNVSDGQEIIVATSNSDYTDGRVYALDGDTNSVLWSNTEPLASEPMEEFMLWMGILIQFYGLIQSH